MDKIKLEGYKVRQSSSKEMYNFTNEKSYQWFGVIPKNRTVRFFSEEQFKAEDLRRIADLLDSLEDQKSHKGEETTEYFCNKCGKLVATEVKEYKRIFLINSKEVVKSFYHRHCKKCDSEVYDEELEKNNLDLLGYRKR